MRIHEAVKKALQEDKEICRLSVRQDGEEIYATIKPTNSYDACLLIVNERCKKKSCRNWNPTADDLIADDWTLI